VQTNFAKIGALNFEEPDLDRFPSLSLARRAGEIGGTLPAVLNAANEVAVERFCQGTLAFTGISELVARVMGEHEVIPDPTLEEILAADTWARKAAV
jgi:1-deoxy-D-xylulose-5-phosphate reductoisomerase